MNESVYRPYERLFVGGVCVPVSFIWALIQQRLHLPDRPNGEYVIAGVAVLLGLAAFLAAYILIPRQVAIKAGLTCWAVSPLLLWLLIKAIIQ